jgi:C1A family cysteine protease
MQKATLLCASIALAAATQPSELTPLWEAWKYKHAKVYSEVEEAIRFAIFSDNHHKILKFNQENSDVKLAINKFADLTATEFKANHASCAHAETNERFVEENTYEPVHWGVLPASVDWRNKGAVTPVKDQGQCGSCWTFSTTGVLEGRYFLDNNQLLSFSEQQIVDCATDAGQGCEGGWPYLAVEYAIKNGLELESDYPYTAQDGTCAFASSKAHQVASSYSFVSTKSTNALKTALVDQPVSVLIEADQSVFQFYSSGVISTGCGAQLDHAVLAVGYDKQGVLEAFIVKNSWGQDWGEQGYVYLSTIQTLNNGAGACGILSQPLVANK